MPLRGSSRGMRRYKYDKRTGKLRQVKPRGKRDNGILGTTRAGFKTAGKVATNKKGPVGGVRNLLAAVMGLGIIAMFAALILGRVGFAIGAGAVVAGGAAGSAAYGWHQRRKGKAPPRPGRTTAHPRHKPFVPDPKVVKTNRRKYPHTPPRAPKQQPTHRVSACQASCRRSKKPKSTCRCRAVPCFHGTE